MSGRIEYAEGSPFIPFLNDASSKFMEDLIDAEDEEGA